MSADDWVGLASVENGTSIDALLANGRKHGVRRRLILIQAGRLFVEQGYAATSMDDIGKASGVSGPAVYRHFPNKQAVLVELIGLAFVQRREGLRDVLGDGSEPPRVSLRLVVDWYVEIALRSRDLLFVIERELPSLPTADRRRFNREERLFREEWVHLVREVYPELSDLSARIRVAAAMGAVRAVIGAHTGADEDALRGQLPALALATLLAPSA
ncbi:TetR family transcriptional regulator [Tamaricihabitans halophyticus]|uniref:TetR family transcriptional regulator n=1 Tax=Tamaricihabitans halophyticus TaxID=1262583 RepID=A0A4V2SU79_9PSEU|nr:TetR/AcrR family transcriptional regulator [Tamaricihabitans halophyticus]TCP53476.1 TetR family transcriptional regulator [Tamaricihabitans halophyticus]